MVENLCGHGPVALDFKRNLHIKMIFEIRNADKNITLEKSVWKNYIKKKNNIIKLDPEEEKKKKQTSSYKNYI